MPSPSASSPHSTEPPPVVAPTGELDLHSSRDLAARLHELAGDRAGDAILDLTSVGFMDSVGLGVVLKGANRFSRQGKRLHVVVPAGPVRRLFDFAGVGERLAVLDTVDEARAATRR